MPTTATFSPGGYDYVRGPFQYSAGVAAQTGYRVERARFASPVPIEEGFGAIKAYLEGIGRPTTAFCACELRSPAPFTDQGFIDFNRIYVGTLEQWGIFSNDDNPVARSNVCPEQHKPAEPCFQAFSYTVPDPGARAANSFVIAGSGEANEGPGSYAERIVRLGDTSPGGMRDKALHVLGAMEARMSALGVTWAESTVTQVYTVHDLYPFFAAEIVRRGAAQGGLTWYCARPPVEGLDYEMDVRGVPTEHVI
ncbi:MAG: hypothetical protein ACI8PT_001274 [Gammaproteobacteria bacterium]|jgi:hypothetical protein